ncbi:MAG: ester cyclase [Methylococcales bacterium]
MHKKYLFTLLVLFVFGCSSPRDESEVLRDWDNHVRTINQVLVNQGDLDRIPEFIAESYVAHSGEQIISGREAVHDFISTLRTAFPDLQVETKVVAVDGNFVSWVRIHRGTHYAEFMGVPPSGETLTWQAVVVSRYEDGLVVEEWGASTIGNVLLRH